MKTISGFRQTSSILLRLKVILAIVALLLLAEAATTYLSGRRNMQELQSMNELNQLTGMATRGSANLFYAREGLEKLLTAPTVDPGQAEVLKEGLKEAERAIQAGLEASRPYQRINGYFQEAFESFLRAREVADRVSGLPPVRGARAQEELRKELLLLRQFELEVTETLRKARIEMQSMSDALFATVYAGRFTPLAVTALFSFLCFAAVAAVALGVVRRLKASVQGLLAVTDRVAAGDLYVPVPVQEHDEIGRLSYAFDRMLAALRQSRQDVELSAQRVAHLQKITARFSRALAPAEVADAVVKEGIAELGADAGAVFNFSADGKTIEMVHGQGVAEKEEKTRPFLDLTGGSEIAKAIREMRPVFLETREALAGNYREGADFGEYPFSSTIVVPLAVQGKVVGMLSFRFREERAFDQRERDFATALGALASQAYYRASLYEEAQKAIEIRDSFLSIAAHELKTPLTSLKLQVQLGEIQVEKAASVPLAPEKLKRVFQVCHSQADRLNSLVDDLLDVGRIESGTIVYNFSEVNLRQLIESVLDRFGEALRLKEVKLEAHPPEPVIVICDTFRIEQVLINLLSNAAKYGNGRPITVTIGRQDGKARFSVRDEGLGIAADKLELIFNRFERAITARNISGLGLGLYISRRIVEAHRGRIWVESELGKGSEFFVELTAKRPS